MANESVEPLTAAETQTRRAVLAAQDAAGRAGSYVQQQVTELSDRAQDLARGANDWIREYTGRSTEAWIADVRGFVRTHPLQALVVTVGVGYVLGKIMKR